MHFPEGWQALFEQLNQAGSACVVLTPNRRLSATLQRFYQLYQLEHEEVCWETPRILPLSSWIQQCWMDVTSSNNARIPLLLNATQEQFLWEKIVLASRERHQLLQVTETAALIQSAWGLLQQWEVSVDHPAFSRAEDALALKEWCHTFQKRCLQLNVMDQASLLGELMNSDQIILPKQFILVGFTELPPQLQSFLKNVAWTRSLRPGSFSSTFSSTVNPGRKKRVQATDQESEWHLMARWAKSQLETQSRIACVIPNLDNVRDRVKQIFTEIIGDDTLFNVSAGKRLLHYPLIQTAFQLLSLQQRIVSTTTFAYLLASPFLGEAEAEHIKRCAFDATLRDANKLSVDVTAIITENNQEKISLTKHCPQLATRLRQYYTTISTFPSKQTYSDWAQCFNTLLTQLGWPGERSLNSEEYQVVDQWFTVLAEFATLDQISEPVTHEEALEALTKCLSNAIFQPKTPDAPIQILGVLEAAGLPFDAMWMAGMDDMSWPPAPAPNPFIPKSLQRELHMPHATAERELRFCLQLLEQMEQSTTELVFSYARQKDELELQVSPLIREVPEVSLESLALPEWLSASQRLFQSKQMETVIDDKAPDVTGNELQLGGVGVIRAQALCPFRAFAEYRLKAKPLETPTPGLRAQDRGKLVHKALELVWKQLQHQEALLNLSDEALNEVLQEVIEATFDALFPLSLDQKQYFSLEKQRLFKLLLEWLTLEKSRPAFSVLTSETEMKCQLGALTLSFRPDRIDDLGNGKTLIIDYKTSKSSSISNWFGVRPDEPQLPLYAVQDSEKTAGLCFAQVVTGDVLFRGAGMPAIEIDGVKAFSEVKQATVATWQEQLSQWRDHLHQLANQYLQGHAAVHPKDPGQTCASCAIKPLCRISEEMTA